MSWQQILQQIHHNELRIDKLFRLCFQFYVVHLYLYLLLEQRKRHQYNLNNANQLEFLNRTISNDQVLPDDLFIWMKSKLEI